MRCVINPGIIVVPFHFSAIPAMRLKPFFLALLLAALAQADSAWDNLQSHWQAYAEPFAKYAYGQGFRSSRDNQVAVLHEMIHLESRTTQSYWRPEGGIAGYGEPWPFRNADVVNYMQGHGDHPLRFNPVFSQFTRVAPDNSLWNALDEINAYSVTAPLLCEAPVSEGCPGYLRQLHGHLMALDLLLWLGYQSDGVITAQWSGSAQAGAVRNLASSGLATLARYHYPFDQDGLPALRRFMKGL